MPNPTVANKFRTQMIAIEADFERQALERYNQFRIDGLDLVIGLGLASVQLTRLIQDRLALLRQEIQDLATTFVNRLNAVTAEFVDDSLTTIRRFEPDIPQIDDLQINQRAVIDHFTQTAGEFIEIISARYLLALSEARQAGDNPQAVQELFSPELVDGRASVYRAGVNTIAYEGQRKLWIAGTALLALYWAGVNEQSTVKLQKQAVATIDKRTTPCCLNVHGQIKDLDEPFELFGTPCGSSQMHPPFPNHRCRTVESPYVPALEKTGLTTGEMRERALVELRGR